MPFFIGGNPDTYSPPDSHKYTAKDSEHLENNKK